MGLSEIALAAGSIEAANEELFLGVGGQHLQYEEHMGSKFLDSESGKQAAITAGASWQGDVTGIRDFYMLLQFTFARGTTAYDGFLQSFRSPVLIPWKSSTDDETADWVLRLGKGFGLFQGRALITPFFQLGDHRWVRNSSKTDPYGYLEIYHNNTVGAGLLGQVALTPRLVATLEVEGGTTWAAEINSPEFYFSAPLGKEPVFGGALGLDYAVTPAWHAKVEVHGVEFRYRQSPVENGILEPDSTTIQSTALLSVAYHY